MQKITVKRLEQDDLAIRVCWFNNLSIYQQMNVAVPLSLADTKKWFSNTLLNMSRRDFSFWWQKDCESTLVAMGGLVDISYQHGHAELYIVVDPDQTGQGIGQKSIQWLCNFGFVNLGLHRIYLFTVENNHAARRLYERLGFVDEGVWRKHIFHQGKHIDRHAQAILRSEWEQQSWMNQTLSLEITVE